MKRLILDPEKCVRCGLCEERCPFGALRLAETGLLHAPGKCVQACAVCRLLCPESAIAFEERSCGGCAQGGACKQCNGKGQCAGCARGCKSS